MATLPQPLVNRKGQISDMRKVAKATFRCYIELQMNARAIAIITLLRLLLLRRTHLDGGLFVQVRHQCIEGHTTRPFLHFSNEGLHFAFR
ncbi:Uncharacterised protein [Yersinia mollaretii]|nr:Uncharacterised protein [Yersinia mollaretii]